MFKNEKWNEERKKGQTCWYDMKNAGIFLLSGSVCSPAKNRAVVHLRDRSVGEHALSVTCGVLVTCLGHVHHFLGVVESPTKAVWGRIRLHSANYLSIFVSRHAVDSFLIGYADRFVWNKEHARLFFLSVSWFFCPVPEWVCKWNGYDVV